MIGFLGLTGPAGAGKDTVYDRLRELGGDRFVRLSVADPLKESAAARWGVTVAQLEAIKRTGFVELHGPDGVIVRMSLREYHQNDGTQAHREIFGDDFWLVTPNTFADRSQAIHERRRDVVVVNTSVRFPNEAEWIIEQGGEVWDIVGPQDYGAAGHASEAPLPRDLVTHVIDNEERFTYDSGEPDFTYLDDQIATLLHGGSNA